jgi:hypothetical protein
MFGQAKASFLVSNPREQRICTIGEAFRVLKSRIFQAKVVSIEEVRSGEFLFGGDQVIALVQRIDQEHGQALISLTRQPNTIGVSGSGILASLVVQAIGSGSSRLAIIQMSASNSEKKRLHILAGDASLFVDK